MNKNIPIWLYLFAEQSRIGFQFTELSFMIRLNPSQKLKYKNILELGFFFVVLFFYSKQQELLLLESQWLPVLGQMGHTTGVKTGRRRQPLWHHHHWALILLHQTTSTHSWLGTILDTEWLFCKVLWDGSTWRILDTVCVTGMVFTEIFLVWSPWKTVSVLHSCVWWRQTVTQADPLFNDAVLVQIFNTICIFLNSKLIKTVMSQSINHLF